MSKQLEQTAEPEHVAESPLGPEGVPVDAPDNTGPAISPHAVSRMHRFEDDREAWEHSPEYSDDRAREVEDRIGGEGWIPEADDIDTNG